MNSQTFTMSVHNAGSPDVRRSVRRWLRTLAAVLCVVVAALASAAQAQTNYTWNTATSGTNWGDVNRWTGAGTQLSSSANWGNLDFTTYNAAAFNNLTSGTVTSISGTSFSLVLSGNGIALEGNVTRGVNKGNWTIPVSIAAGVSSTWSWNMAANDTLSATYYSGTLTGSGTLTFNTTYENTNQHSSFLPAGGLFAGTVIQNSLSYIILPNMGSSATTINQRGGIGLTDGVTYQQAFVLRAGGNGGIGSALSLVAGSKAAAATVSGSITLDGVYNTSISSFSAMGGSGLASAGGRKLFLTGNVGEAGGARNMFTGGNVAAAVVFSGSNSWSGTTGANSSAAIFTRPLALYGGTTANWTSDKFRNGGAIGIDPGGFSTAEQDAFLSAVTGSYAGIGSNGWQSGASFALYSASSSTFSRVLSNVSGSTTRLLGLAKYGTGEVVIQNTNNTFTGVTRVYDGTLSITSFGNGGSAGSIGQALSAAANVVFGRPIDAQNSGASVLRYVGSGETTDRSFTLSYTGFNNASGNSTLDASGSGELIMTGTGIAWETPNSPGAMLFFLGGTNTGTNVLGLKLTNPAATVNLTVQKIGPGTWKLSGTNEIRGGVRVSSGKLILGNTSASGTNSTITIGLDPGFSVGGTTTPILGLDFTDNYTRNISLSSTDTAIEALAGRVATVSGVISGGSTTPLRTLGSGVLVFSGSNTYTGTTTVAEGQLRLSATAALPGGIGTNAFGTGTSYLVLGTGTSSGVLGLANSDFSRRLGTSGSTFRMQNGGFAAYGADRTVNVGGNGGVVTWDSSNANFSSTGTFVLGASDSANRVIFANQLTGTGAGTRTLNIVAGTTGTAAEFTNTLTISTTTTLRKIGSGLLLLSGSTVGSGTFDVAAGTLKFGSGSAAAGSGRFLVSSTSSTLDLGGNTLTAATVGLSAGQVLGDVDAARLEIGNVTDTASITGVVSGNSGLTKGGAGRLTLSGSNSYSGTMTVNAGELRLADGGGLFNARLAGSASGSVSFGSGVTSARFAGLDGSAGVSLTNAGSGTVALALTSGGTYSGVISGLGGLTHQSGMLRLEGANTYTGNTILKGGTVALGAAGSIANSGTVIVGDAGSSGVRLDLSAQSAYTFGTGQTLGGIGTVAGGGNFTNVTISGVLSPGNSPGLLTFDNANLVLDSTSNTLMEIAGTTLGSEYDAVVLAGGTLTYGGTLTIDFGSNLFTGGTFNLFEFKDAPFAYFDTVIATGSYYSGTFTKDISSGTGVYTLSGMGGGSQQLTFTDVVPAGESSSYYGQLVIVPEPVMLGLLGIASGVIVLAARRRAARIRQHAARQGDQAG